MRMISVNLFNLNSVSTSLVFLFFPPRQYEALKRHSNLDGKSCSHFHAAAATQPNQQENKTQVR
jgi:hypothetical protein